MGLGDEQRLTQVLLNLMGNAIKFMDAGEVRNGYIDSYLGEGIVGGPLLSTEELGRRMAAVAVRILGGEPPGNIKTSPLALGEPVYH